MKPNDLEEGEIWEGEEGELDALLSGPSEPSELTSKLSNGAVNLALIEELSMGVQEKVDDHGDVPVCNEAPQPHEPTKTLSEGVAVAALHEQASISVREKADEGIPGCNEDPLAPLPVPDPGESINSSLTEESGDDAIPRRRPLYLHEVLLESIRSAERNTSQGRFVNLPNRWSTRRPSDLRAARKQDSFVPEINNYPRPSSSVEGLHISLTTDTESHPSINPEHSSLVQTGPLDELSAWLLSSFSGGSDKISGRLSTTPAEKWKDSGLPVRKGALIDTDHTKKITSSSLFGGSSLANSASPNDYRHSLPQEVDINAHQRPVSHIGEKENEVPAGVTFPPGYLSSLAHTFSSRLLQRVMRAAWSKDNPRRIDKHVPHVSNDAYSKYPLQEFQVSPRVSSDPYSKSPLQELQVASDVSSYAYSKSPLQEFQVAATASCSDAYSRKPPQALKFATRACFDAPPVSASLSPVVWSKVSAKSNSRPSHSSSSRPVASSLELREPGESPTNITSAAPARSNSSHTDTNPLEKGRQYRNPIHPKKVPLLEGSILFDNENVGQGIPMEQNVTPQRPEQPLVSQPVPVMPDRSSSGGRKIGMSSTSVKKLSTTARVVSRATPSTSSVKKLATTARIVSSVPSSSSPSVVQSGNPRLWSLGGSSYPLPASVNRSSESPTGMELIEEELYAKFLEEYKPPKTKL